MARFDKRIMIFLLALSLGMEAFGNESSRANYAEQVVGFWRVLGVSATLDGELRPWMRGMGFWYFNPDGTLITAEAAAFVRPQPYDIDGKEINSNALGEPYTIVSLQGDRMILEVPEKHFWHLERRHFDASEEHSGRYYSREEVSLIKAEADCLRISEHDVEVSELDDPAVMLRRLAEQLERRGLPSLDMDKFDASVKYYLDDPEFLLKDSEAATERIRSCMKAHGLGKFVK